jgi:hypothetical protein
MEYIQEVSKKQGCKEGESKKEKARRRENRLGSKKKETFDSLSWIRGLSDSNEIRLK